MRRLRVCYSLEGWNCGDLGLGGASYDVQAALREVDKLYSPHPAFFAVLKDGPVVTWGSKHNVGDSNDVQPALRAVDQIYSPLSSAPYSRGAAFAAVFKDGAAADDEKELLGLQLAENVLTALPAMLKAHERQNEELSRRLAERAKQEQVGERHKAVLSCRLV